MNGPREAPAPIGSVDAPKMFETNVEVDGVPFIFGATFAEDESVYLYVRLPADEITRLRSEGMFIPSKDGVEGVVGFAKGRPSKVTGTDFYLYHVATQKKLLEKDAKYKEVFLGRFLMRNFIALSDMKGWRLSLTVGADGPADGLTDAELIEWYKRLGFEFNNWSMYVGIRQPQQPDATQPIAKILAG